MRITVFGATGNIGQVVVAEALKRGHHVTAVTRSAAKAALLPATVDVEVADVSNISDVIRLSQGQDLVISATRPSEGQEKQLVGIADALLEGLDETRTRLLLVGGAACLTVPDTNGQLVLDDEAFVPPAWKNIAQACYEQFQHCVSHRNQNWTYMSPSALIGPGARTGQFRISDGELLIDKQGKSHISWQDFAVALLDEAQSPQFLGGKFTVGY
ncbi:NADH-flavin reductase [Pseudoalteromonas luteoviolacea]|uniref:NADH-flavin reductase n=1 Tax=Pseudoalteromonas luteoviolacea TaxID=43657 RepID=A0A1C0TPY5_9GAMM|nr:NAD(P)H-binding protein [Pseudoalteromonas luteoviolacea]OCQ21003.1 NADH-flavin reductase [Pseudoalteromonas luteoviolacea]